MQTVWRGLLFHAVLKHCPRPARLGFFWNSPALPLTIVAMASFALLCTRRVSPPVRGLFRGCAALLPLPEAVFGMRCAPLEFEPPSPPPTLHAGPMDRVYHIYVNFTGADPGQRRVSPKLGHLQLVVKYDLKHMKEPRHAGRDALWGVAENFFPAPVQMPPEDVNAIAASAMQLKSGALKVYTPGASTPKSIKDNGAQLKTRPLTLIRAPCFFSQPSGSVFNSPPSLQRDPLRRRKHLLVIAVATFF